MKLNISGPLNATYAQTLCLLFFPGEKFPVDASGDTLPRVDIEAKEEPEPHIPAEDNSGISTECDKSAKDDKYSATVKVMMTAADGKISTAESTVKGTDSTRILKIAAGRAVFEAGRAATGITPPWGILSGVRPSKAAWPLMDAGMSKRETTQRLIDDYLVTPERAKLAADVTEKERTLLSSIDENDCALYVAIPFCLTRCAYCSFISYASPRLMTLIPEYIDKLAEEIKIKSKRIKTEGKRLKAIYIGGGTPTILSADQLRFLLDIITKSADMSRVVEFTLESGRPDTITADKLNAARSFGVDRISVNPQTISDETLERIGRAHTAREFFNAYEIAAASGIPHINVDIIAGLPGETVEDFEKTADAVKALSPDNITVHTFCVKNAAYLKGENVTDAVGGGVMRAVDYARNTFMRSGYEPYYMYRQKSTVGNLENVGYAKPGTECLYNIMMMEEVRNVYAAGAGAVTKLVAPALSAGLNPKIIREFNPKYPYEYLYGKPTDKKANDE